MADSVHAEGGRIVVQVMHGGRVTHPEINGGRRVEAPSAVAIDGEARTSKARFAYPVPEALTADALPRFVVEVVTAVAVGDHHRSSGGSPRCEAPVSPC